MAVRMKTGALDVKGVDRWYVTDGANSVGPVRLDLLTRGVEAGRVPLDSFVRHEAWKVWRPLTDFTDYVEEQVLAAPLPQFPLPDPSQARDDVMAARQTPSKRASLAEFASAEGVPSKSSSEGFSAPEIAALAPHPASSWSVDVDAPEEAEEIEPDAIEPDSGEPDYGEVMAAARVESPTDISRDVLGGFRSEVERKEILADLARTQKIPGNIAEMARPAPPPPPEPSQDTLVRAEGAISERPVAESSQGEDGDRMTMPFPESLGEGSVGEPGSYGEPAMVDHETIDSSLYQSGAYRSHVPGMSAAQEEPGSGPSIRFPPTDDIPESEHGDEGWGAARPADSADALPDDDLTGANDLSDALLLFLGGVVKRTGAEAALLFRMDDDGAKVMCAHGPGMIAALGTRIGILDPSIVAAASGHLVVAEPSPGSVGQGMLDRAARLTQQPSNMLATALLVPIQIHGRLFGFVELTKASPFAPRQVVKAEDLALAFARHVAAGQANAQTRR